jgi:ubiquitin-protein ligase
MSNVRLRRLQADYEKLRAFLAQQPRIRLIQAQGTPPERYQLEFQIKGLREVDEQLQTVANHMVEIALPLSYPRLPPQCRMLTPVFHPNIAPHAICIGDHWAAGEPLWSMVARIGEMIAYQSYNTKSPLNGEAARWVEANQHRLPLDRTNFVMDDRLPPPESADPSMIPFQDDPPHLPAPQPAVARQEPGTAAPGPGRTDLEYEALKQAADAIVHQASREHAFSPEPGPARPPDQAPGSRFPAPSTPLPAPAPNIIIECAMCRSRYSVPSTAAGRKVRCKKCQAILLIPAKRSLQ